MSLGELRSTIIAAFEAQTGRTAQDAWPLQGNCWRVVDTEGKWHTATIRKEG